MANTGLYCATCQRQTLHTSSGDINHVLHALLGLLTCTLWWFVWLAMVLTSTPTWLCSQCGSRYVQPGREPIPAKVWTAQEIAQARVRNAAMVKGVALAVAVLIGLCAAGGIWNAVIAARNAAKLEADHERVRREMREVEERIKASASPSPRPRPSASRRP